MEPARVIPYGVLAYFLLIAAGVVIFALPGSQARVRHALGKRRDRCRAFLAQSCSLPRFTPGHKPSGRSSSTPLAILKGTLPHPIRSAGIVLLLLAPSLTILNLNTTRVFEFDTDERSPDPQIAILLVGERLTPPPPLPPEAFTTREIETSHPDVIHASRNWQLLDAEFVQRLLISFRLMEQRHGYRMTLIEGYRSPERQAQLFDQGSHVTRAKANMSYHQYGLAADSAFLRDGKIVISERDPWTMRGYELYGQIAEELGLTWGGRWQFRDFGHVELRRKNVLGQTVR